MSYSDADIYRHARLDADGTKLLVLRDGRVVVEPPPDAPEWVPPVIFTRDEFLEMARVGQQALRNLGRQENGEP